MTLTTYGYKVLATACGALLLADAINMWFGIGIVLLSVGLDDSYWKKA